MPEKPKRLHQLICDANVSEDLVYLCDVRSRLKETGVGDIIVGSFMRMADAESYAIDKLSKVYPESRVISDVSNLFKSFEHDFISLLLREVGIDTPVCSGVDDRECLTVKTKLTTVGGHEYWSVYIIYIDSDGKHIIVYG
jgi:hypothetical protein